MSWPLASLGEVASFINGDRGKNYPSKGSFVESGIPFINAGNLESGDLLSDTFNFISEDKFDSLRSGKVENGDILFCLRGSLGKYAVVRNIDKAAIASSLVIMRPNEKVDLNYLKNYLGSTLCKREIEQFENGAAQPNLSATDVKKFKIPLPPLEEQKRIAAILDKADSVRRKRQQAIDLADNFLRSVFLDMFGDPKVNPKNWVRCKFSDLINLATYGLTVRPEYISEGIPLISAREIRTGSVVLDTAPKISQEDFDKLSDKAKPKVDDILFSKTGSIGHCAIVTNNKEFAVTQNAARIVPNTEKVDPVFLLSLMRTKYFYDLSNREAKGNAVKDLQLGVMKEFEVYCPPLEKQIEFVRIRKNILEMAEKQQNCSQGSDNNLFALSQKAFAAEL